MKTPLHFIALTALAAIAFIQSASAVSLPASMPEFMSRGQVVKWQEERIEKAKIAAQTLDSQQVTFNHFYTGRPYDMGAYLFKYRQFDVEIGRWRSADLFGFPDGANNHRYSPTPTSQFDYLGAWRSGTPYGPSPTDQEDRDLAAFAPAVFIALGEPLSSRAVSHLIGGTTATISDLAINSSEQSAIVSSSEFAAVRNYVDGYVSSAGGSPVTLQAANNHVMLNFTSGDLGHSLGHVTLNLAGTITPYFDDQLDRWFYSDPLTITFSDPYDFALGGGWQVDVFARLQNHGWSSAFSITGNWAVTFTGSFE